MHQNQQLTQYEELRQHFFLSSIHIDQLFQQLIFFWSDLIKRDFVSTSFYHRFHTDQYFNSWFFRKRFVSIHFYHRFIGLARSETSTRCRSGNGPLGLANIWSRLLKHNWWNPLYERVRIHSDVFFDFKFNENSSLYDYINRASLEFQPIHVYDQQLCSLFYRCESLFFFLNSWR